MVGRERGGEVEEDFGDDHLLWHMGVGGPHGDDPSLPPSLPPSLSPRRPRGPTPSLVIRSRH